MTRVLASLLGSTSPSFQLELNQLERASGLPGVDIRLTSDILRRTKEKLRILGLDPNDTTPEELYQALSRRLERDSTAVMKALGISDDADAQQIIQGVSEFIQGAAPDRVLALKHAVLKRLLKQLQPLGAMKLLGYRSLQSMLKNEPVQQIMAAARITESDAWWQQLREAYTHMLPSDFEQRRIAISAPMTQRWQKASAEFVKSQKQNCLSFPELGSIVLLPMPKDVTLQGLALVLIMVAFQSLNDIRSSSSYLKFHQVKADFGDTVRAVASGRVYAAATLANQPVAWQSLHHYYAQHLDVYPAHIFEPHMQAEDLRWDSPENTLAELDETLEFWQDSQNCALVDANGRCVSMNLFDAVLNYSNNLPFSARALQYLKSSVWRELTDRYLQQKQVEQVVSDQLAAS